MFNHLSYNKDKCALTSDLLTTQAFVEEEDLKNIEGYYKKISAYHSYGVSFIDLLTKLNTKLKDISLRLKSIDELTNKLNELNNDELKPLNYEVVESLMLNKQKLKNNLKYYFEDLQLIDNYVRKKFDFNFSYFTHILGLTRNGILFFEKNSTYHSSGVYLERYRALMIKLFNSLISNNFNKELNRFINQLETNQSNLDIKSRSTSYRSTNSQFREVIANFEKFISLMSDQQTGEINEITNKCAIDYMITRKAIIQKFIPENPADDKTSELIDFYELVLEKEIELRNTTFKKQKNAIKISVIVEGLFTYMNKQMDKILDSKKNNIKELFEIKGSLETRRREVQGKSIELADFNNTNEHERFYLEFISDTISKANSAIKAAK